MNRAGSACLGLRMVDFDLPQRTRSHQHQDEYDQGRRGSPGNFDRLAAVNLGRLAGGVFRAAAKALRRRPARTAGALWPLSSGLSVATAGRPGARGAAGSVVAGRAAGRTRLPAFSSGRPGRSRSAILPRLPGPGGLLRAPSVAFGARWTPGRPRLVALRPRRPGRARPAVFPGFPCAIGFRGVAFARRATGRPPLAAFRASGTGRPGPAVLPRLPRAIGLRGAPPSARGGRRVGPASPPSARGGRGPRSSHGFRAP